MTFDEFVTEIKTLAFQSISDYDKAIELSDKIIDSAVTILADKPVDVNELYHENTFLIGQWTYMEGQRALLNQQLLRKPGDIKILATLQRIEHDLAILKPTSTEVNRKIISYLEKKYSPNQKFKYLKTMDAPDEDPVLKKVKD